MKNIITSFFVCFGFSLFGQVQPYEIEYAPADNYILLSKTSPSGEYDHAALSSIGLSEFSNDLTGVLLVSDTAAMLSNYALNSDVLWDLSGTYSLNQKNTPNNNFFFGTNVGNTITTGSNNFILGSSADAITVGNNNFIAGNDNANVGTTLFSANTVFGSNNLTASLDIQNNFISGQNNLRDNTGRIWSNAIFGANNFIDGRGEYILGGGANSYTNTTANNQHSLIWGLRNGHLATTKGVLESSIVGYQNLYSGGSASRSNIIGFDNVFSCTGAISNSAIIGFKNGFASTGNFTESLILGNENLRTGTAFSSRSAVIGSQNAYNSSGLLTSVLMGYQNLYAATTQSSYNYLFGDRNYRSGTTVINSFAAGVENGRDASSVLHTSSTGYRNFYQATGTLSNSIAIGRENGYNNVSHSNSIYLGYRQGYTTGAANRLMVGMTQDSPLIYGEFDNDLVRINGDFEVEQSGAVASTASIINGTNTWNLLNTGASGDLVIEPQTIDGDVIFRDQTNDEWVVLDNTNKKIKIDEDDLVPTSETDMRIAGMQDNGTSREFVSVGIGDGLYYDSTTDEIASTFVSPNAGVFKDASLVIGSPTYEDYAEFTETIDLSAVYSISGDVITVAEAGVYFFSIAFEPNIVSGTTLNRVTLELNGSDYLERDYDELAQTITMTGYLNLSDDDELKLSIQQFPNGGTADDIQFTIHRVGIAP